MVRKRNRIQVASAVLDRADKSLIEGTVSRRGQVLSRTSSGSDLYYTMHKEYSFPENDLYSTRTYTDIAILIACRIV